MFWRVEEYKAKQRGVEMGSSTGFDALQTAIQRMVEISVKALGLLGFLHGHMDG
jgi:hypothetical protein